MKGMHKISIAACVNEWSRVGKKCVKTEGEEREGRGERERCKMREMEVELGRERNCCPPLWLQFKQQ